jgi:hypothetical protein
MNYKQLINQGESFSKKIRTLKEKNSPQGFTWYGYDILANLSHLNATLSENNLGFLNEIEGLPIADIGAADGDLGFFFEAMGFNVDIIDWPKTNWNGLQGAYYLKQLLDSSNGIYEIDLDSFFTLPKEQYGLTLLLGILYHLKNPYYILEHLAKRSKFCFLSTRVAQFTTDGSVDFSSIPIAYLLNPDECNNDSTNYWIFSHLGLNRIIERSGWEILDIKYLGNTIHSNPSSPENDERAFVLMKSKYLTEL